MKKCPTCVKYFNDDAALLCQYCGTTLLDTQISPDALADTLPSKKDEKERADYLIRKTRRKQITGFVIASFVLLILILLLTMWLSSGRSDVAKLEPTPTSPVPQSEQPMRGVLLPANEPLPPNSCAKIPPNAVLLYYGNSVAYTTSSSAALVKTVSGEDLLSFEKTSDGIYVNAIVRSADNQQVARVTKNVLRVDANSNYYRERPDQHSVVILDANDRIVLYVRYLNPSAIKILGIFHNPGHPSVIIDDDKQTIGANSYSGLCFGSIPEGGSAFLVK